MNPTSLPTATSAPGSLLEQLPITYPSAAERSRAIRELVSFAMEGPLVPAPLTPMPVPVSATEIRHRASSDGPPPLPLPTTSIPFQARW